MTKATQNKGRDTLSAEAIRWFVLLDADEATAEERRQFQEWLIQDPAHETAYHDVQRFWAGLDSVGELNFAESDHYQASKVAVPRTWLQGVPLWQRVAGMVALCVLVILSSLYVGNTPALFADYRTAAGEQRTLYLADGSIIDLNTNTAISIDLADQARRVTLHQGEAFFTVAYDPGRPFDVLTKGGRIQVLGTAFNVRSKVDQVVLTVMQDTVQVSLTDSKVVTRVSQGQHIAYDKAAFLSGIEQADLDRTSAWRRQRLMFEDRKLSDVIEELNRYRRGHILILGDNLEKFSVTGVFDIRNTDKALRTIKESLPVRTVRLTDYLVLLYSID